VTKFKTHKRDPETNRRARLLRHGDNMAEALLWNELKDRELGGYKFVKQFPVGSYFADFLCRKQRLVVELDGSQHADSKYDRHRDEFMSQQGYAVLRFGSADVVKDMTSVCETILAALDGRLSEDVVAPELRFVFTRPQVSELP
jgi:very-short-patch-repair endonuclease